MARDLTMEVHDTATVAGTDDVQEAVEPESEFDNHSVNVSSDSTTPCVELGDKSYSDASKEKEIMKEIMPFKIPIMVGPRPGSSARAQYGKLNSKSHVKTLPDDSESSKQLTEVTQEPVEKLNSANLEKTDENTKCENGNEQEEKVCSERKSPAEQLREKLIPVPYKEPPWSGLPVAEYKVEVLKNGKIISVIDLSRKSYWVFGRLANCDVQLEHPSLSRHHAVIQYRSDGDEGFYLYDLGSTHGTFLNKNKVIPHTYHRMHVGHVVKFAGSSRLHILIGPEQDEEKETEFSVTELKSFKRNQDNELKSEFEEAKEKEEIQSTEKEDMETGGIDWGLLGEVFYCIFLLCR